MIRLGGRLVRLLLVRRERVLGRMASLANAKAVGYSVARSRSVGRSLTKMTESVLTVSVTGVVGLSVDLTCLIAAERRAERLIGHIAVLTVGNAMRSLTLLLRRDQMIICDVVLASESAFCLRAHQLKVCNTLKERGLVALLNAHFGSFGNFRGLQLGLDHSLVADLDLVD